MVGSSSQSSTASQSTHCCAPGFMAAPRANRMARTTPPPSLGRTEGGPLTPCWAAQARAKTPKAAEKAAASAEDTEGGGSVNEHAQDDSK